MLPELKAKTPSPSYHPLLSKMTNFRAKHAHLCERQVDAVCEGCDDQPPVQAHVLIAVAEGPRALADVELIWFAVPVKAQLAFPLKLPGLKDAGWGEEEKEGSVARQTLEGENSKTAQHPREGPTCPG